MSRNTIQLDLTRDDVVHVISDDSNSKVRYRQDGIEFTADGKAIGDPTELIRKKQQAAIKKAEDELARRKAEILKEAEDLGLDLEELGGKSKPKPTAPKKPGPKQTGSDEGTKSNLP